MKNLAKVERLHASLPYKPGFQVLELKLSQVRPDPNQPRTHFDEAALRELASSIDDQGLQQLPTVNFSHIEEETGERIYVIKAGERRYRAHELLKRETITVLVEPGEYSSSRDVQRILAQAAENSSRLPHSHAEIIAVMQEVINDEMSKKRQDPDTLHASVHGAIEIAIGRVAKAFGKSRSWALNYRNLVGLHLELREMMSVEDENERLPFASAMVLARVPAELQRQMLAQALPLREKGGPGLVRAFLTRQVAALSAKDGRKGGRRRPHDDKSLLLAMSRSLQRISYSFIAERHSSEQREYVRKVLAGMSTIEVDQLLSELKQSMLTFQELLELVKARRNESYSSLSDKK